MLKSFRPFTLAALALTTFVATFMITLTGNKNIAESVDQTNQAPITITVGGEPAQAWFWSTVRAFGIEKTLDQCINGGCQSLLKHYGKSSMKSRVYRNEVMYVQNDRISPARQDYHNRIACVDHNTWLSIVSKW